MSALGQILSALATVLGILVGGPRCIDPAAEPCLAAMAQTYTQVPLRCAPESTAYNGAGTAAGEYYGADWRVLTGLPEEAVIYYTAAQATEDHEAVVALHRTVIAHELGHSWWMTHATPEQRASLQALLGWASFDEEAAADVFAMTATYEWRDYWGGWSASHPFVPEPTPAQLYDVDALDLVPELGGPFVSFAPLEVAS